MGEYAVSACLGKQAFESPGLARDVARKMARTKRHGRGYAGFEPYRCKTCGKWHVGPPVKRS